MAIEKETWSDAIAHGRAAGALLAYIVAVCATRWLPEPSLERLPN